MKKIVSHKTNKRVVKKSNARRKLRPLNNDKELRWQAQSTYLDVAIAERDMVRIFKGMGIDGDDEAIQKALDQMEDQEAANEIRRYLGAYDESFGHRPEKLHQENEIAEWLGVSKRRVGQIMEEGLKNLRVTCSTKVNSYTMGSGPSDSYTFMQELLDSGEIQ
jgi:DNA-directed RNA polymerase sigma subunit (sigma70/sigma32)